MADIDKITVNNTTYDVKDATARDSISRFVRGSGVDSLKITSPLENYVNFTVVMSDGTEYTLSVRNAILIFNKKEVNGPVTRIWNITPTSE